MPFEPPMSQQAREELMAERGWGVVQLIGWPGDPASSLYSYTVGLTGLGHPELLALTSRSDILEELGSLAVGRGRALDDGELVSLPSGAVLIRDVYTDIPQVPEVALDAYGPDGMRLQQVVLPDDNGVFPGRLGYQGRSDALFPHVSMRLDRVREEAEAAARWQEILHQPPKRYWWWPPSWFW